MKIQLSEHFNYKKLFKFTFPSIIMMIFTSIYGVVDGLFVSNFVGKTAFTAVNFAMPVLMILGAVGFMFGTGGSAIIAKTMGEGKPEEAKRQFSMFVYSTAILGTVLAVLGIIFIRPTLALLGAEGSMLDLCVLYGRIILCSLPALTLQFAFQSFFIAAEKPDVGLKVTVAAGVTNMVLDALLIAVFPLGIFGAALATAISQCVGGIIPIIYFARKNPTPLKLTRPEFHAKPLAAACINGSSELLSNIAMSVVGMLYNVQLLKYAGEDGVAAYGVLMYVNMIFLAIFIGYSMGTAPVVSFHYGAGNYEELQSLRKKSLLIIGISSVVMFALAEVLARPLAMIFSSYDRDLLDMTVRAFFFYSFSFLFSGFAIWSSSFFTALNNGVVSAIISFLRTLVFQVVAVLILPVFLKLDGIWLSIVAAEFAAVVIGVIFLVAL
ncbi:MAG: MATE family efflux transporter, partial [Eubacteriales bacterium]